MFYLVLKSNFSQPYFAIFATTSNWTFWSRSREKKTSLRGFLWVAHA